MTSALWGKWTKVQISCVRGIVTRREGVQESGNVLDVINGSHLVSKKLSVNNFKTNKD